MLQHRLNIPAYDPFVAPRRWMLRLGSRFYYPIAGTLVAMIVGLVLFVTFISRPYVRVLFVVLLIGVACLLVLYWRVERLWLHGNQHWLVRILRPDLSFVWAGIGVAMASTALLIFIIFAGVKSADVLHLWPVYLFPLLFLSERDDTFPYLLILTFACGLLFLLLLFAGLSLSDAIPSPIWLATVATSNYYLARRFLLTELRTQLVRQVANQLSNTPEIESTFPTIASLIAARLRYEHVHIWILEPEAQVLELHAAHGAAPGNWVRLTLPLETGLFEAVLQQRRPEGWNNVEEAEHYSPLAGFEWIVSSLAVPIVVRNQAVGILSIVSRRRAEFWEIDIDHLTVLADSVGIALARSAHVRKEAERLRDMLAEGIRRISECSEIGEMFIALAEQARIQFGADLVVLYQLAPGTSYPLLPPFYGGDFRQPEAMDVPGLPDDSALFDLLEQGRPYYSSDATRDPLLAEDGLLEEADGRDRFVSREGVQATVFLPVGEPGEFVGALFLHFREAREFPPQSQLTLEAFATVVAEQINRERRNWQRYVAFGGQLFGVHGSLMVSADSLRRFIAAAQNLLDVDPKRSAAALDQAAAVASKLEFMAMLHRLGNRDGIGHTGLRDELRRAATKITQYVDQGCRLHFNLSPDIDELPLEIVDVLYCLAVEAVANAAVHGGAQRIGISIEVAPRLVELEVVDNGSGFAPDIVRPGPDGIFEGIELAERQFGATGRVTSQPGAGTEIHVQIPRLEEKILLQSQPKLAFREASNGNS